MKGPVRIGRAKLCWNDDHEAVVAEDVPMSSFRCISYTLFKLATIYNLFNYNLFTTYTLWEGDGKMRAPGVRESLFKLFPRTGRIMN
jgi:hypothetical protein